MKAKTRPSQSTFTVTYKDPRLVALMEQASHRTLAIWATQCTERVLPHFEAAYPDDRRPQDALVVLQEWVDSGEFNMATIRTASLAAHAAARAVGEDNSARSSARAAGQAVATAHVRTHAIGAANYAVQAVYRAANSAEKEALISVERDWQYHRLQNLIDQFDHRKLDARPQST